MEIRRDSIQFVLNDCLPLHVNGISRLHRSEAQKSRRKGVNYVVIVKSPLGPQRCNDNSSAWLLSPFFLFNCVSSQVHHPLEVSSEERNCVSSPLDSLLFDKKKSVLQRLLAVDPL